MSNVDIPAVALRYQNVYGPGQSLSNPYTGILSIFSTRILNGNDIDIYEDGEESRDFVFINDVVDATVLALEKEDANHQIFNVGSGVATTVSQVANSLKEFYNSNVNISISGKFRLGDIRHNYADLTKAKNLLGFSPKFDFKKGISEFVTWVKTQEIKEENIKVFTIGIGTINGGKIPEINGYKKDYNGQFVHTKLNRNSLTQLSELTKGEYYEVNSTINQQDKLIHDLKTEKKILKHNKNQIFSYFYKIFLDKISVFFKSLNLSFLKTFIL